MESLVSKDVRGCPGRHADQLGTSMSAAVVGGDVDELASVRATVGKAEAGVDQENATEEREGMAAKEGLDANQVGLASLVVAVVPTVVGVWRRSLIRCGLHEGAGSGERGT
jgi:hypothetical protein